MRGRSRPAPPDRQAAEHWRAVASNRRWCNRVCPILCSILTSVGIGQARYLMSVTILCCGPWSINRGMCATRIREISRIAPHRFEPSRSASVIRSEQSREDQRETWCPWCACLCAALWCICLPCLVGAELAWRRWAGSAAERLPALSRPPTASASTIERVRVMWASLAGVSRRRSQSITQMTRIGNT